LISWNALYVLDLFALALFALSYYRKCYRRGYRIDLWHAQLFLYCVLPNMVMLPFAKSELNILVLGRDLAAVTSVLPFVFLVTLLGYAAVLVGSGLWRLQAGLGLRKDAAHFLEIVPQCSMMLMSARRVLIFQAGLCFVMQLLILGLYFSSSGFAFDLRGYTFENPTLRPVALVISNYSIVIASHCLARYVDTKERILLLCTLGLTFGLVFFGARGNLLAIYISVLLCYFVKLRDKVSLFRIVSLMTVITVVGFYLGNARAGDYSLAGFFTSFLTLLFYGNTFSDLRDFAWVYSAWDHVFWGGKTYLAAIMSFIPRFASHFRDTWAMGVATASTVGFDPQVHPGLRPGVFGEGYFNFGLAGVVAVGLFLGFILRHVDSEVKRAFSSSQPSMMRAFASTMLLSVAGCVAISAGFSGLYTLAGIYLFSWFCLSVERVFRPARKLAHGLQAPMSADPGK
jgi:oligosaccharide repeat unit polymerase